MRVPEPEHRPLLTVAEVAEILGVTQVTVYARIHRGELPVLRFGRRMVVPTAALRRLLGIDAPHDSPLP